MHCESNNQVVLLMELPDSLAAQQDLRKLASPLCVPGSVDHSCCLARQSDGTLQATPELCSYLETGINNLHTLSQPLCVHDLSSRTSGLVYNLHSENVSRLRAEEWRKMLWKEHIHFLDKAYKL